MFFETVLRVESAMIDVENAWEILHFVQNDGHLFTKDRESRQWILLFALNKGKSKLTLNFQRK